VILRGLPLRLLPLTKINDQPTIDRAQLIWIHGQLIRLYGQESFLDGTIDDPEDWVRAVDNPHTCFFLLHHGEEPVMVIWINEHKRTHAAGHWFWLQSTLPWKDKVRASRWALGQIFTILPYEVLVGKTPSENRRAIDFMRAVGMTVAGEIPSMLYSSVKGHPVDATLLYITREDVYPNENLQPDQIEH
jgi:hypothetical protein